MGSKREIHLLAYLKTGPTANHMGGWRHPESELNDLLEPSRYEHIAKVLEAACFDGLFFADGLGLHDIYKGGFEVRLERGGQISFLDPMMVLPLMARATTHIGIGATLSTTSSPPNATNTSPACWRLPASTAVSMPTPRASPTSITPVTTPICGTAASCPTSTR